MNKRYDRQITPAEKATSDSEIDFSDIPELDDAFWRNAQLVEPDQTEAITLFVKRSVLDAFMEQGDGYKTRMNAVLEAYAQSLKNRRE